MMETAELQKGIHEQCNSPQKANLVSLGVPISHMAARQSPSGQRTVILQSHHQGKKQNTISGSPWKHKQTRMLRHVRGGPLK